MLMKMQVSVHLLYLVSLYCFAFAFLSKVDLPSTPLDTDGPALQHLGKTRPKPARMQRSTRRGSGAPPSKPSALVEATITEAKSEEKPIPEIKPKPKEKVDVISCLLILWR